MEHILNLSGRSGEERVMECAREELNELRIHRRLCGEHPHTPKSYGEHRKDVFDKMAELGYVIVPSGEREAPYRFDTPHKYQLPDRPKDSWARPVFRKLRYRNSLNVIILNATILVDSLEQMAKLYRDGGLPDVNKPTLEQRKAMFLRYMKAHFSCNLVEPYTLNVEGRNERVRFKVDI